MSTAQTSHWTVAIVMINSTTAPLILTFCILLRFWPDKRWTLLQVCNSCCLRSFLSRQHHQRWEAACVLVSSTRAQRAHHAPDLQRSAQTGWDRQRVLPNPYAGDDRCQDKPRGESQSGPCFSFLQNTVYQFCNLLLEKCRGRILHNYCTCYVHMIYLILCLAIRFAPRCNI